MLLGTLGASLIGNLLTGKAIIRADEGTAKITSSLNMPHPLTNFGMQKCYQNDAQVSSKNEPKLNGVYSRYNFPKKRMGHK